MVYLDEDLPNHPKIWKAGLKLGPDGPAFVFTLHVAGLAYARKYLTNGFLPDEFVMGCRLVRSAASVAEAMCDRKVKLWHRVRGGYRINDFLEWNKSATEIKAKRKKDRDRKRQQRAGNLQRTSSQPSVNEQPTDNERAANRVRQEGERLSTIPSQMNGQNMTRDGNSPTDSNFCADGLTSVPRGVPLGQHADVRAESRGHDHDHDHDHVRTSVQPAQSDQPARSKRKAAAAPPLRFPQAVENPTRRQLVKLTHTVIDEHPDDGFADLKEAVKDACARHKFAYNADTVGKALESALAQRRQPA